MKMFQVHFCNEYETIDDNVSSSFFVMIMKQLMTMLRGDFCNDCETIYGNVSSSFCVMIIKQLMTVEGTRA